MAAGGWRWTCGSSMLEFRRVLAVVLPPVARKNQPSATPASIVSFASHSEEDAVNRAFVSGLHSPVRLCTQPLPKRACRRSFALFVSRRKSSTNEYNPRNGEPFVWVRNVASFHQSLLIGICFLDAPRFKENCFCLGFISFTFYAFLRAWQRLFKATLRGVLAVFAEHGCGNGRRLRCMANLPGVT